jgi:hypothetical protein
LKWVVTSNELDEVIDFVPFKFKKPFSQPFAGIYPIVSERIHRELEVVQPKLKK